MVPVIKLEKRENKILAQLLVTGTWYVLVLEYIGAQVYVDRKGLVLSLILSVPCIYSWIDKQRFPNAKIEIGSSILEFRKSCRRGINLCLNSQTRISEVYSRSETSQINLE